MRRKSFSLLVLLLSVAMLAACTRIPSAADTPPPAVAPSQVDTPPPAVAPSQADTPPAISASSEDVTVSVAPPLYDSTIEYGAVQILLDDDGPAYSYISYLETDDFADDAIAQWANDQYQRIHDQIDEMLQTDPNATGEININCNSYLVDSMTDSEIQTGQFVGIIEQGMSNNDYLAHPVDIIKTFNLDLVNGVILQNSDILDPAQESLLLSLLRERIETATSCDPSLLDNMDSTWLANIAIGHGGIIVLLERSVFLPTYLGTVTVTLPYDELGSALLIGKPLSVPMPNVTPNVTPSEAPAPESPVFPTSSAIDPNKPMVALTFDDGPSKYTAKILDLLEEYDVHATFCVVGNLAKNQPDTIRRAYDLGNEIIGHSWDHRSLTKLTTEQIQAEIMDTYNTIQSILGVQPPMLYRPPYGAVNNTVKQVSTDLGFSLINWNVDTLDWKSKNADKVYNAIMSDVKNHSIILCHDLHGTTADAMVRVIPALIAKGYQLVTVSQLLQSSGVTVTPGKVYFNG